MAHYQNQYGATAQGTHEECAHPINPTSNPIRKVEYGNPVDQHTAPRGTGVGQGTHGTTTDPAGYGGTGYGAHGAGQGVVGHQPEPHGVTGKLRQSGNSSSSSEDDEEGGRRKKGSVIDKVKEKLPGAGRKEEQYGSHEAPYGAAGRKEEQYGSREAPYGATNTGCGGTTGEHQQKGALDMVKEKLPGGQKPEQYGSHEAPYGAAGRKEEQYGSHEAPYGAANRGCGGTTGEHQQKGPLDKVKEKLPGGQKPDQHGSHPPSTTKPYGGTPASTGTAYAGPAYGSTPASTGPAYVSTEPQEKKGMMEKIKEKLPGAGNR